MFHLSSDWGYWGEEPIEGFRFVEYDYWRIDTSMIANTWHNDPLESDLQLMGSSKKNFYICTPENVPA